MTSFSTRLSWLSMYSLVIVGWKVTVPSVPEPVAVFGICPPMFMFANFVVFPKEPVGPIPMSEYRFGILFACVRFPSCCAAWLVAFVVCGPPGRILLTDAGFARRP